jgi:hypothetical protein
MKSQLHFIKTGLLLCIGIGCACQRETTESLQKHQLERNIADLRSDDFHVSRSAQSQIVSEGKLALPLLFDTVNTSTNSDQPALCCYLIGQIDCESYASALKQFAVPGKLCSILQYPNQVAIKKLPQEQRKDLLSHFIKLDTQVSKEESKCIQNFLEMVSH